MSTNNTQRPNRNKNASQNNSDDKASPARQAPPARLADAASALRAPPHTKQKRTWRQVTLPTASHQGAHHEGGHRWLVKGLASELGQIAIAKAQEHHVHVVRADDISQRHALQSPKLVWSNPTTLHVARQLPHEQLHLACDGRRSVKHERGFLVDAGPPHLSAQEGHRGFRWENWLLQHHEIKQEV